MTRNFIFGGKSFEFALNTVVFKYPILVNFFIVLSKITYTDDPPFDNRGAGWASDTRSKGEVERKSFFNKGREESFPSLQPIQVEISMLGTDPNIPVERN